MAIILHPICPIVLVLHENIVINQNFEHTLQIYTVETGTLVNVYNLQVFPIHITM